MEDRRFVETAFNLQADGGECALLISQAAALHCLEARRLPYVFTETGIAMLSSVIDTPMTVQINIGIIRDVLSAGCAWEWLSARVCGTNNAAVYLCHALWHKWIRRARCNEKAAESACPQNPP